MKIHKLLRLTFFSLIVVVGMHTNQVMADDTPVVSSSASSASSASTPAPAQTLYKVTYHYLDWETKKQIKSDTTQQYTPGQTVTANWSIAKYIATPKTFVVTNDNMVINLWYNPVKYAVYFKYVDYYTGRQVKSTYRALYRVDTRLTPTSNVHGYKLVPVTVKVSTNNQWVTMRYKPTTWGRKTSNRFMMQVRSKNYTTWNAPYTSAAKKFGKTTSYAYSQVKITNEAQTKWGIYYQIQKKGRNLGWINRSGLKQISTYRLPYNYFSQLYQGAPQGCEGAALQMALSAQGLRIPGLREIYAATGYGWHLSPYQGFYGNPWNYGYATQTQTIYAAPFAAKTKRFAKGIANMTGASRGQIINEIRRGNAVVTWGDYAWNQNGRHVFHVMTIVGYRYGQFLIADPYAYGTRTFWVSTAQWEKINTNIRAIDSAGRIRSTPARMNVVVR
ncbi:MAG: C39 family peptidase [Lactobacillaceae bacterium]|jgi:uncharacterized protein YvpB|nr:C39 family peptidase [Lactobacillaceae bacterium]